MTGSAAAVVPPGVAGARQQRVQRVKNRLYPLTPFTKALEFLVECLPRQLVDVALEPDRDVLALTDGEYRANGERPSFAVRLQPPSLGGGWFYLEAALVRHTGDRDALFQGSRRATDGTLVEFEIPIPSNLRGSVREVIRIPAGVESLFWIPMRAPGYFAQSELLLHRVSGLEAWLRRAHRVLLSLWQQRHASLDAKEGLTVGGALRDLQDAYLRTARMQIRRYRGLDYAGFIARLETPSRDLDTARRQVAAAAHRPRFRLIVDLPSDADPEQRDAARDSTLRSVRAQEYGDQDVVVGMGEPVATTPAGGDFVLLLEAGDILAPHALLLLAQAILAHPAAVLLYPDHDSLDAEGRRSNPQFKPDWNPDLLPAYDYLGGVCCIAGDAWRDASGDAGSGPETSDAALRRYARVLRITRACAPERIVHVPRVLVHRPTRAEVPPSAASEEAARRVVAEALAPQGAIVEPGLLPGTRRVRYPVPAPAPLVTIIVPTRDKLEILRACIESVCTRTDYPNFEICIIDNRSVEPETLAWLRDVAADPRIRVLRDDRDFNYSALNNRAVAQAAGSVVVLLNNDIEVIAPDWLTEMVSHALRPEIGAVGAKLLYPNGMVQHAGVVLGIGGVAGHVHRYLDGKDPGYMNRAMVTQNLSVVTAACLAVRKAVYEEVGGLDEENLHVAFNDVDFCIRLTRAGYRNLFTPHALLTHHESLSRGHDDTPHKKAIFEREFGYMKRRWGPFRDPAYNPNLTLEFEDYSLRRS